MKRSRLTWFTPAGRRLVGGEGGFTAVEAVMALGLATIVLTGLVYSLGSSFRVVREVKQFQQATGLGVQAVEAARDVPYHNLSMRDADLAGDPRIDPVNRTFDPDAGGPLAREPIVSSPAGGAVFPHITQTTIGGVRYTISRYVTWVDAAVQGGPAQNYKRFSTSVTWNSGGRQLTYRASAFIARSRRGLSTPKFELAPTQQTLSVEPGNQVVFAHTIKNLGLVDTFDLAMPVPTGRTWLIELHKDVDQNGQFDSSVDTPLFDTNSNGQVDTDSVFTDQTFYLLAVWTLSENEATGVEDVTLTARSGAFPASFKSATDKLRIGQVNLTLYLHDDPTPPTGDAQSQAQLPMTSTAPTASTLFKYSTDFYTQAPGRFVDKKTTDDRENDRKFMVNWIYQLPGPTTTFDGNAELRLWVAKKDLTCDQAVTFKVYIRQKNSANTNIGTVLASATATSPPGGTETCNFRLATVSLPMTVTIAGDPWMELKVTVEQATGDAALFAYDTATFNASLSLPQVSS